MAMNLVQQGEDLQDFSDEALAGELQTGQRGYLPIAVISEIERRVRDRERYQQNAMAQQAGNNPVAQQRLMELMAQGQPQGMGGMEGAAQAQPQPGMAPQAPGMGMGMPGPMAAPQAAPVGIMGAAPQGMPVQGMAEGGMVRRAQAGMSPNLSRSGANQREVERILRKGPFQRTPEENEILRAAGRTLTQRTQDPKGSIAKLDATFASPFIRKAITGDAYLLSDEDLALAGDRANVLNERIYRGLGGTQYTPPPPVASSAPGIGSDPSGIEALMAQRADQAAALEFAGSPSNRDIEEMIGTGRGQQRQQLPPQFSMPPRGNFMADYERMLRESELQPVNIRSRKTTEQEARDKAFYAEEQARLSKFAPDKERFKKEREADLLVGLGSVIAGATRRGDIAQGLAGLAAQQREAQRGFRQEEREYEMGLSALRRAAIEERRADAREQRGIEREDRADERAARAEALAIFESAQRQGNFRETMNLEVQKIQIQIASAAAAAEAAKAKGDMDAARLFIQEAEAKRKLLDTLVKINADPSLKREYEALTGQSGGFTPIGQIQSSVRRSQ